MILPYTLLALAMAVPADCNGNGIDDAIDLAVIEPLAYWRFEDLGGVIVDSGPNGLDGLAVSIAPITDVPVDPVPKTSEPNAFAVDFTDGLIEVADPGGLLTFAGESFTIEAWVRLDQLSDTSGAGQRQYLLQKKVIASSGDVSDYSVLVQSGNLSSGLDENFGKTSGFTGRELLVTFGTGTQTWGVTSNLQISDLDWHAVSVAYDAVAGEVRFGRDGMFETIPVSPPGFFANVGPLIIGAHTNVSGSVNQHLKGAIDELRIVDDFMPDGQLLASYEMADCNGNGVPDGCDVADGTSADCDGNGAPDECELVGNDCDGNGIPDQCDPDCNGNGIADACDIAGATSDDCQPDGIPDECQLDEAIGLFHDSGFARIAWRADETYMAWLNRFNVVDGAGTVEGIEVEFGIMSLGTQVGVYVWTDPNGDGDPTDAQVLWSDSATVQQTSSLSQIAVPDVEVGDTGASFFVGFTVSMTDQDFPAALDIEGVPVPDRSWGVGSNAPIDPNDLSAGAVEFGTVNNLLFGNVFIIRAQMRGDGTDCNGNGNPDDCDIEVGTSEDLDGNGVPDECEDCNDNGIVDGFDIAGGTSADCQADGVPDECQVTANDCDGDGVPDDCQLEGNDCNDNGILDACDIASGYDVDTDGSGVPDECEDCNGNGLVDSLDLLLGSSDDCDGDGVPDECQLGEPVTSMTYALDDGVQEGNLCFIGGTDLEFAWMNPFTVQAGGEWISAIEVVWGDTFPDLPAEVVLWTDPNGDGDPTDAQVIITVDTRTMKIDSPLDNLNVVPIPPTYVGPVGTAFFVGVHFDDIYGSACFIALDRDEPTDGLGWIFYDTSGSLDLNDLGAGVSLNWGNSDFLVHAVGSDGVLEHDANVNGIPDECECPADLDGSGDVGFGDILAVIGAWGPCGSCPEDLNDNGSVDFADILIIIASWGAC
ncbi:MAG: LamG domain-containing protein [Planctomycetes bacterium]|nr:LamG domain-containing protein [Planctomycetota bacterium]